MRRGAIVMLGLLMPAVAWTGEIKVGMDAFGLYPKRCHVARFVGPAEAASRYEKRQKDRFEKADPEQLRIIGESISVTVNMEAPRDRKICQGHTDRPEKIVIAEKGSAEPLLTIPLEVQEYERKNLAGATFAAYDASALVPVAEIERLRGKEYDCHLIFGGGVQKETWKKDYVAKILK